MGPLTAFALVAEAQRRGVRLAPNGDRLRVEAPAGVVTPDLLDALRACKVEILDLLSRPAIPELPDLEPGATHAVYFTLDDGSTERAPRSVRTVAEAPCAACGRRAWWLSIHDALVCGVCHPPARAELVAEWLGDHDA